MVGFGMQERGFNTIISGMIVSYYSAVASHTGREGMFVAAVVMWMTLLITLSYFAIFRPKI